MGADLMEHIERRFVQQDAQREKDFARMCELMSARIAAVEEKGTARVDALAETTAIRLAALEKALALASSVLEVRLGNMNEVRAQLLDQAAEFVKKAELTGLINVINTKLESLMSFRDESKGKASQTSVLIALALSILSGFLGISSLFLGIVSLFLRLWGGA